MRNEELMKKWTPILEHTAFGAIQDSHKKAVTATILENTEKALNEGQSYSPSSLLEAAPTNNINIDGAGEIDTYNPVLISLVRRAMPNLIAYDIAGVQPMTGPTGLIFAMRSRYGAQNGAEAMYGEANTAFAGAAGGVGMTTAAAEALGDGVGADFAEMSFSIEKVTVEAKSRALKAEYTTELSQDLRAVHGLDAESELSTILSTEITAEINREVLRNLYDQAKLGCAAQTTNKGIFDLTTDADGRWSVENFKALMFQIEKEANVIAKETRRGKGNVIVCSSDVASALAMSGLLDYNPQMDTALNVDDTGQTFAGVLNKKFKVYIDPYFSSAGAYDFAMVGYRGSSPFDAGYFYCPYVPMQMVRAVGENTFQPKIGFKTRYGMVKNPFAGAARTPAADGAFPTDGNQYYRLFRVDNINSAA